MNTLELLLKIEKRKAKERKAKEKDIPTRVGMKQVIRFYYGNIKLAYSGGRILMVTDTDGNIINRRPEWAKLSAEAKTNYSYIFSKLIIEEENDIIKLLENKGVI